MKVTLTADMPIMLTSDLRLRIARGARPVIVKSVPKDIFVDVHERQCDNNHRQTLERIRERGGFDAGEVVAVLSCLKYSDIGVISEETAHYVLYSMIATMNRGSLLAKREVSEWVAKLHCAAGCSCCRNDEAWNEASDHLGQLLEVPRYDDDSGVNWPRARDEAKRAREVKS